MWKVKGPNRQGRPTVQSGGKETYPRHQDVPVVTEMEFDRHRQEAMQGLFNGAIYVLYHTPEILKPFLASHFADTHVSVRDFVGMTIDQIKQPNELAYLCIGETPNTRAPFVSSAHVVVEPDRIMTRKQLDFVVLTFNFRSPDSDAWDRHELPDIATIKSGLSALAEASRLMSIINIADPTLLSPRSRYEMLRPPLRNRQ